MTLDWPAFALTVIAIVGDAGLWFIRGASVAAGVLTVLWAAGRVK